MTKQFVIRLADVNIGISHRNHKVKQVFGEYIVDAEPELNINITDEDIRFDRERYAKAENREPKFFAWRYYEATSIYHKICLKLMDFDAFLLHAAVVAVDGKGYAFLAKSGVGKTTHAKYWINYFGERAYMVNGDKPIVRILGNEVFAYGTPICGKENENADIGVPLKAIFFLERGQGTKVTEMPSEMIPERITSQLLIPKNGEQRERIFDLADRVMNLVPMYRLSCDTDLDSARTAWENN